jgi:hypothetical protein
VFIDVHQRFQFSLAFLSIIVVGCQQDPNLQISTQIPATETVKRYSIDEHDDWPDRIVLPLTKRDHYLFVPGHIDGSPIGAMMIDTGATLSVVAQGIAGRLGLPVDGQGRTVGIGGVESFDYHRIDRLELGGSEVRLRLLAEQMAGINLHRFGGGIAGIVGFTDLSDQPFTLDSTASLLTVHRADRFRPPPGVTRHRLHRFRQLPMVRAWVVDGQKRVEVWLIVDYGADHPLTLPANLLRDHPGIRAVAESGTGWSRGVGGNVSNTQTWLNRIDLFNLPLQQLPVSFEQPPLTMRSRDRYYGRIGNSLLRHFRLTFDAPRGWVYAEWLGDNESNDQ